MAMTCITGGRECDGCMGCSEAYAYLTAYLYPTKPYKEDADA